MLNSTNYYSDECLFVKREQYSRRFARWKGSYRIKNSRMEALASVQSGFNERKEDRFD